MRGGHVPGSVRCTSGEAEWVLAVSVAKVSRKRGISGKSLCRGSEIRELVRASHSWSSSVDVDGPDDCSALMVGPAFLFAFAQHCFCWRYQSILWLLGGLHLVLAIEWRGLCCVS